MLKQATLVLNLPIISMDVKRKIGEIKDFVIDPQTGKILAFVVQKGGLFKETKVVSCKDIQDFKKEAMIKKITAITLPDEIVRVKQSLEDKIKVIGNRVITESGSRLGKVEDFVFDTNNYMLIKLYVRTGVFKDLFQGQIIIPREKICSIGRKSIIIFDDIIKEKAKEAEAIKAT